MLRQHLLEDRRRARIGAQSIHDASGGQPDDGGIELEYAHAGAGTRVDIRVRCHVWLPDSDWFICGQLSKSEIHMSKVSTLFGARAGRLLVALAAATICAALVQANAEVPDLAQSSSNGQLPNN